MENTAATEEHLLALGHQVVWMRLHVEVLSLWQSWICLQHILAGMVTYTAVQKFGVTYEVLT